MHGLSGAHAGDVDVGSDVTLQVNVTTNAAIPHLVLGYMIKDRLGQPMYGTNTALKTMPVNAVRGGDELTFTFAFAMNLGPGTYSIATALSSTDTHLVNNYEWRDLAMVFTVANLSREHFVGVAWIDPVITIERNAGGAA